MIAPHSPALLPPVNATPTTETIVSASLPASMFAQQPMPKDVVGSLPPRSLALPGAVGSSEPARQPSQASSGTASADYLAAADFLARMVKAWPDHWHLNVCAIPARGGPVTGKSWAARDVAADREKIAAWLERENRGAAGIYWTPNPLRASVQKKPTKADLAAVVRLAVDLDPPGDDRPFGERRAVVLKAAGKMQQDSSIQPSLILDSGNGIGVFFDLAEPELDLARAEAACRALHSRAANEYGLKVDGTHNSDRLMRLPRTLNWPNAKKIAAGYSRKPSGSRVLYENGAAALNAAALNRLVAEDVHAAPRRAVSVSVLPPPTPAVRAQQDARIAEACKVLAAEWPTITSTMDPGGWPEALKTRFDDALIDHRGLLRRWQGHTDGLADTSRSGLDMALVATSKAAGFDLVETARILWTFRHGKMRDEPTDAAQQRAVARAWVRSEADRKEDADARDRVAAAGHGAAERTLADALASTPELVPEMLKCSVLDDAVSDVIFARELAGWAARANMGKVDLRNLRKRALTAATRARADAEKRETAAGRPIIEVSTDLHSTVEQSERALRLANPPALYDMGGHLVVVGELAARPENSAAFASVPPAIVRAGPDVVRAELSRVALFTKGGAPIPVPHDVADTITGRAAAAGMPRLRTVRPFPLLREDGSVAFTAGYDRATDGFVTTDWSDLALPNAPTQADAKAALAVLLEPFDDFPMHPQEGRGALAAYILVPFVRHLVPTVPLFAISAPTAGSGKTLLAQAAGSTSLGAPPALMAALTGPGADEEMRKRFTAQLLAGRGDMILDNVPRDRVFGSPALDALVTSPVWGDRVLGSSTSASFPNTAILAVTGNNMQMAPDTARRTIWAYLDAKVARPEERQGFKYRDLMGHIAKERPRLVKAALTVLQAYILHADPFRGGAGQARVLGSFEGWSRTVAGAVEWAGLPNPISTQNFGRGLSSPGDDELDAMETLFGALEAVFGLQPFTAGEALKAGGITGAELEPVPPTPSGGGNVASGPSDAAQAALGDAIRATLGSRGGDPGRVFGKALSSMFSRTTKSGLALVDAGVKQKVRAYRVEQRPTAVGEAHPR